MSKVTVAACSLVALAIGLVAGPAIKDYWQPRSLPVMTHQLWCTPGSGCRSIVDVHHSARRNFSAWCSRDEIRYRRCGVPVGLLQENGDISSGYLRVGSDGRAGRITWYAGGNPSTGRLYRMD